MNNNYWYDIKEDNGSIIIDKKIKEEHKENIYEHKEKHNKKWKSLLFIIPLLFVIPFLLMFFFNDNNSSKYKYRTFMIYMVGSDLETNGKIASYDLNDINGNKIDLENNNVLLMVGGSKKWHNFVNEDEVGLYKLTNSGFKKEKTYRISSMGEEKTLQKFFDYVTETYKSDKYDLIFWNHGLGALGIEDDEVYKDFLNIAELNNVFSNTKFAKEKLELVIFNNCMSGNIHIASIMKNYADYMVASEEIMYVGSIINRLDFLNNVKKEDNGYDIALSYINKSDESIAKASVKNSVSLETTLSIIDLSKIDKVEENMNEYFSSIDLDNNYKDVSRARRKTTTYGDGDYVYDTIDLYSFVDYLSYYLDGQANNLQKSIKEAVLYNSSSNDYSNGISFYFPYYGTDEHISTHLYYFNKLWNNEYTNFINEYVDLTVRAKKANRVNNENILKLKNDISFIDNKVSIELTPEEKEKYQSANVYIFEKVNNTYKLLMKTDEIDLYDNKLISNDFRLIETIDYQIISSVKEKGFYKIHAKIDDADVLFTIDENGTTRKIVIDSGDKPFGGLVDYDGEFIKYYALYYNNLSDTVTDEWNININKESLNNTTNGMYFTEIDIDNYYVLIEMFDINNDAYYKEIVPIK